MHIEREYIEKAEQLLLPVGCHFDDERKAFINRLDSGDLLAVPGSGKTTALRAKLYCMAQNLPLKDERGILAISHTNVAVDELKLMLQSHCPQLFEYPNFIGTIQDFVDTFLALPYYVQKFGHRVDLIDAEKYEQECEYKMRHASTFLRSNMPYYNKIRFGFNGNGEIVLLDKMNGKELNYPVAPKWRVDGTVEEKHAEMRKTILKMKCDLMREGVLHFDDCYFLAESYMQEFSEIIDILRNRFAYVFVDEAQDLQQHQLEIIDKCFNCDAVVLQRIGDPNQSIFNGTNIENSWVCRNPLYINNSHRLTPEIASIVDHLILYRGDDEHDGARFMVNGINRLPSPIQPFLLLYSWDRKGELKNKFIEIIQRYRLQTLPEAVKYGFHIIGWNAEKKNNKDFRRLEDIFPEYNRMTSHPNATPSTLSELIQQDKYYGNFAESRKGVLEALVIVLRLLENRAKDGRQFTRAKVLTLIAEKEETVQQRFQEELYKGTIILSTGQWLESYVVIKGLLVKWLADFFNARPSNSVTLFLEDAFVPRIAERNIQIDVPDNVPITIGTVHSVKGMTHCATMYVETSFHNRYESEYMIGEKTIGRAQNRVTTLISPFYKHDFEVKGKYAAMAKRMLYVGFSRPTHLLCFASDQGLWDEEKLNKMREAGWNIEIV